MRKNQFGRLEMYPLPEVHQAKMAIIGEYPNTDELKLGKYFVSEGGKLLDKVFASLGIPDEEIYKTVAVPYLINKKSKSIPDTAAQRVRLIGELKKSQATLVVPLGAMATSLLLGTNVTMKKVLGNILTIAELPGVTIIPNYHPALLLHNPGTYKEFNAVMNTIGQYYIGNAINPGVTDWKWAEEEKIESGYYCSWLRTYPAIGVDIETSSLHTKDAMIWVMGVATQKNKVIVFSREHFLKYPKQMRDIFATQTDFVWHHGKYDTEVLHWSGFETARLDQDTIYLHYCTNETGGTHGLGTLATIFLGADEYKSKMNSEFAHIDTEEAYKIRKQDLADRVATDADYTLQLYEIFKPMVDKNPDWTRVYNKILMPGSNFLRKVQMRGAKVDVPYLRILEKQFRGEMEDITDQIIEAAQMYWNPDIYKAQTGAKTAGELFKPTSVKQLAWLIYDRLKLRPTLRKRGKPRCTDEEVLASIEHPPEFIIKILELRKVKKKLTTYVTSYLENMDENEIVHACFNLHITTSGRLSCTDPNLQNVPSKTPVLRRSIVPRGKDRILMEVDYSGAELKVLAWISQDPALIKAVTTGDLHSEVAADIFGPDFTKVQRGIAKTVNFGIAYGRGANDLSTTFNVSVAEAQSWIDSWAIRFPLAWAYLQSCEADVLAGKTLKTVYGRWRRFGLIHQAKLGDLINEAKNFRIQSISSDNCFLSAIEAEDKLVNVYDAYIINLIHDSILIDCPADVKTVQAVSQYMTAVMLSQPIKQFDCNVPFACDTDLGPNWGDVVGFDNEACTVHIKVMEGGKKVEKDVPYVDWIREQGVAV
jgi:DNA polymerase-1